MSLQTKRSNISDSLYLEYISGGKPTRKINRFVQWIKRTTRPNIVELRIAKAKSKVIIASTIFCNWLFCDRIITRIFLVLFVSMELLWLVTVVLLIINEL